MKLGMQKENEKMKKKQLTLEESIAIEMWNLINSDEKDWSWCVSNNSELAQNLLSRARYAINRCDSSKTIDLSLKNALVNTK